MSSKGNKEMIIKPNEKIAIQSLYDLLSSFSDSDGTIGDHPMKLPMTIVKKMLDRKEVDSVIEMIGNCANCEGIVDRNSHYEDATLEDECGYPIEGESVIICTTCLKDFDDEELNEKGFIIDS